MCASPNELCDGWIRLQQAAYVLIDGRPHGLPLLRLARLLERRGAAHVGAVARHAVGPVGRDCLHWCVAPGVLDALALSTLAQLADVVSGAPPR